jgi:hypothetical protein
MLDRLADWVQSSIGFPSGGWFGSGRLPDFVCLGAQKAGTTSLHHQLLQHPRVFLPPKKELHYFSLSYHRSTRWYAGHFAKARPDQLVGEVTPYYLFHPHAPEWIARLLPQVRLIVLLRDPVERALSGYFHSLRLGHEPLDLEPAFAAEPGRLADAESHLARPGARHPAHQQQSYLSRSRYELQLNRYLARFPANQLLILQSEWYFQNPEAGWRRVLEFLELPRQPLRESDRRHNVGAGEAAGVPTAFRQRLREELRVTYEALERDHGITWETASGGVTT